MYSDLIALRWFYLATFGNLFVIYSVCCNVTVIVFVQIIDQSGHFYCLKTVCNSLLLLCQALLLFLKFLGGHQLFYFDGIVSKVALFEKRRQLLHLCNGIIRKGKGILLTLFHQKQSINQVSLERSVGFHCSKCRLGRSTEARKHKRIPVCNSIVSYHYIAFNNGSAFRVLCFNLIPYAAFGTSKTIFDLRKSCKACKKERNKYDYFFHISNFNLTIITKSI